MNTSSGEHASKVLNSGLEAHLVRRPGSAKWKIRSVDISWLSASQGALITKTWFPDKMGLADREFDSKEAAFEFLEKHAKVDRAPAPPEGIAIP
jgi:IS5 family transposase